MSYISAIRKSDEVIVWERTEKCRILKRFPAPYYFYVRSPNGEHKDIYGHTVLRIDCSTNEEFRDKQEEYENKGYELYESDIPPEIKVLSEHYYNATSPTLNVTFLDIELDYDPNIGFPTIENPYAPINSVALYHSFTNSNIVISVPPKEYKDINKKEFIKQLNVISPLSKDVNNEFIFVKNEKELLERLLDEIEDSDEVCGWNSEQFDIPYLGKRLEKLGKRYFIRLSFPEGNKPRWRSTEIFQRKVTTLDLSGRISADYMLLFKKYEVVERPSYRLESIAEEQIPDFPKLEYAGSLADLYKNDFVRFVRYNLRDVEILYELEKKLGYISVATEMYHMSTGLFQYVTGTVKLTDYACVNYCHYVLNRVVNNIKRSDTFGTITGAYVLNPKIGMHSWIGAIDIASLYPSSIRSLNISPETVIGQFEEFEDDADAINAVNEIEKESDVELTLRTDEPLEVFNNNKIITLSAKEWKIVLRKYKMAISGYGTVFSQEKQGFIPAILEEWYNKRVEYKELKSEAKKEMEEIKKKYSK